MSQTQILNFRLLKALMMQLRHYGLNPTDWRVCRSESRSLKELSLVHRNDQDFIFRGEVIQTSTSLQWDTLALVSL
jgi:hypothetical protein